MKKLSKTGLMLAGVYASGSLLTFIYALTCHSEYCGLVVVGPVMPWMVAIHFGLLPDLVSYPWLFVYVFLTAAFLYVSGVGLEKLDRMAFFKNKFSASRVVVVLFLLANALYFLPSFYYAFFA